ncbi:hypothetical protein D0T51_12045 [Parabacteroides sp. 52]|uniref:nSTAND1 domain-containing NTPase n=1 Tax=unclassified Parabacteroides TaxID=2649774 RepID=UPI0013D3BCDA|nr:MULTISPECIES: restriction endonuclease [unclassified Parabacteroides]MDH6535621.1 hypothetical protein [Parabacteroides sp. PM5-20]NDV56451.1 hypothetical protein [Parabacteroides sp. 52]
MKSEIKIILEQGSSNKAKGNCFEALTRNLLNLHQYKVKGNINFSGMEIDLMAEHKHTKDSLYVECKAKDKVSADELSKFAFNVDFREADKGYFFRTQELEYQAGALLSEIRKKQKYKKLTFFEPTEIIQMLSDGNMVYEPLSEISEYTISKKILAITYLGDFFIYLINESNALPTKIKIVNAKNNRAHVSDEIVNVLKQKIDEISSLTLIPSVDVNFKLIKDNNEMPIETISELQESENWYDYLPASDKHFIGRYKIRNAIWEFFYNVIYKKTNRRIFYLTGKSGWGKSSLIAATRGRCMNMKYKNNFFLYAVDCRSATSSNFVALAFQDMMKKAKESGFIENDFSFDKFQLTSNYDIVSSNSINKLLKYLKKKEKVLILVFDQFEDVFRKKNLFRSFYKFLTDVTDARSNLVVGFSWKSETLIPSDNEAYHYWQQAKEQSEQFTMEEFASKEIDGVINQLERSLGELRPDLRRRIKDNTQGLPWLTKKLCIHIHEQVNKGIKQDKLIDENLNIKELFKNDLEQLDPEEIQLLKYIAKRTYDGNTFDITELEDFKNEKILDSLRDKRLIVRSGINYNLYWDVFRDFLITNEIPIIGESYILRSSIYVCLETFLLFKNVTEKLKTKDFANRYPKKIKKTSIESYLYTLRAIGLIQKTNEDEYTVSNPSIPITKEGFRNYLSKVLLNYTPYNKLKQLNNESILLDDVIQILKETFKYDIEEKTWAVYARSLIGWIHFSNLEIKNKLPDPKVDFGKKPTLYKNEGVLLISKNECIRSIEGIKNGNPIIRCYDSNLFYLNIIDKNRNITSFGEDLSNKTKEDIDSILTKIVINTPKFKQLSNLINRYNDKTVKGLVRKGILDDLPIDFFNDVTVATKKVYLAKMLSWLR